MKIGWNIWIEKAVFCTRIDHWSFYVLMKGLRANSHIQEDGDSRACSNLINKIQILLVILVRNAKRAFFLTIHVYESNI